VAALFIKRGFWILIGLITVLFIVFMAAPSSVYLHRSKGGHEQSITERFTLWKRALRMIEAHPVTGIGINTYSVESERYTEEKERVVRRGGRVVYLERLPGYYAHNSYLQLAAESGLISLGLYIIFLGCFFWKAAAEIRTRRLDAEASLMLRGLIAGTVGFLILNLFETLLFSVQGAQLYYFFLGSAVSLIMASQTRKV